jgi:hypothetical protein
VAWLARLKYDIKSPSLYSGSERDSQHAVILECQEWLNQAHVDRDAARFFFTLYCDKCVTVNDIISWNRIMC